jgi:hypothetical protein
VTVGIEVAQLFSATEREVMFRLPAQFHTRPALCFAGRNAWGRFRIPWNHRHGSLTFQQHLVAGGTLVYFFLDGEGGGGCLGGGGGMRGGT